MTKLKIVILVPDKKPSSIEYLTFFNCGHIKSSSTTGDGNNQTVREFTLIIEENQCIPIASNGLTFFRCMDF